MQRVRVLAGEYKGKTGDAFYHPTLRQYMVCIPNVKRPEIQEMYLPESVRVCRSLRSAPKKVQVAVADGERPILVSKQAHNVAHGQYVYDPKKSHLDNTEDNVIISGCKSSCNSVWCQKCYTRRGGSKRFSDRLAVLDWRSTRQVVLTVDLEKFGGCGQKAYETLRESKAIAQFIHNLKRTYHVHVEDWVWVLEWHESGAPHWHLFIQTKKGASGKIGNEKLLKAWKHGLVFESFIRSKQHWNRFTEYFGNAGYFDPKQGGDSKKKGHQLHLPEWAMNVTYRIRKTGAKTRPKTDDEKPTSKAIPDFEEDKPRDERNVKTYREMLGFCGEATNCAITRGDNNTVWKKIPIPYNDFKQLSGEYIKRIGYQVQMSLQDFMAWIGLYDNWDIKSHEMQLKGEPVPCAF